MENYKKTTIIAHRGVSSSAPENTLIAFRKAIQLGADYFELDVQLSRDGIPVVMHDDTLERTTNIRSRTLVSELTIQELKALDAGSWFHEMHRGETIPTLEEALLLPRKQCGVMVEIKASHGDDPEAVAQAVQRVINRTRHASPGPIVVASFSQDVLNHIQALDPMQQLLGLSSDQQGITRLMGSSIRHLGLDEILLTSSMIRYLHSYGYRLWTFTVNDIHRAIPLRDANIEGIITNVPHEIRQCLSIEN